MKKNGNWISMMKRHFKDNPKKLYSVVYFSKKWNLNYETVRYQLEKMVKDRYLNKYYFSANQGLFAWGVPKPMFAVYVLRSKY